MSKENPEFIESESEGEKKLKELGARVDELLKERKDLVLTERLKIAFGLLAMTGVSVLLCKGLGQKDFDMLAVLKHVTAAAAIGYLTVLGEFCSVQAQEILNEKFRVVSDKMSNTRSALGRLASISRYAHK